jgi:3-methyl-2-oxobutanoate hydroxymethyltransferase
MSTRPSGPAPATPGPGKVTLPDLREMKRRGQRIVMVTAYDYPSGVVANAAAVDMVLVGDSAAMTVLGHDSTVPATMEEMLMLARATTRGATHPLVVADLPFLSYQLSDRDAILNAGRFVKEAGADAVKLEGAGPNLERIRAVTGAGMPVMGHLGLTPQTATSLGGFKAQGRTTSTALELLRDARSIEAAGAFSLVLECVPEPVAAAITDRLTIPVIGIGAGAGCDGQVLVYHDLLGLGTGRPPRFVKQYANLHEAAVAAVTAYAGEVRSGAFPAAEHTYAIAEDELDSFQDALEPANPVIE